MIKIRIVLTLLLVSPVFALVGEFSPEELKKNAYEIDKLVAANFRSNNIKVPDYTDDATFMRRAFLVSVGRIPTAREALDFLELDNPDKRDLLIGYLMNSEGYNSHTTNWLYDLLTLRDISGQGGRLINNERLIEWVREAVASNMPWDEFTSKLLTTRGNAYVAPGAAGYFNKGDAVDDHLSNTLRVFTGVRMECAQCHDDPFQEWEQIDFYGFKALVDGVPGYNINKKLETMAGKIRKMEVAEPKKYRNNSVGRLLTLHYGIMSKVKYGIGDKKGVGRTKLPKDYQYSDGDPGEVIGGRTAFGARLTTASKADDIEALNKFAKWMVSDKTPEFSQTIAMRLWERVMGVSLTQVTGDYVNPKDTNFKKLIPHLSQLIKTYDYDVKAFQSTLMLTRTFQFVSSKKDLRNGDIRALDGRRSSRMTAEQIWDSFISLVETDPESLPKRGPVSTNFNYNGQFVMTMEELADKVSKMNISKYEVFLLDTYEKLKRNEFPKARHSSDGEAFTAPSKRKNKGSGALQRASEIKSPAPNGHFLAVFGQSRREGAIDEASKEGTVSQA